MEQVHRRRGDGPFYLEAAQEIGLRLVGRSKQPHTGRYLLGHKLPELAQLDKACIRIIAEIPLGKRAKSVQLRSVLDKKREVI
jgi:hypothetical protein